MAIRRSVILLERFAQLGHQRCRFAGRLSFDALPQRPANQCARDRQPADPGGIGGRMDY
jgi:hypothetical protein